MTIQTSTPTDKLNSERKDCTVCALSQAAEVPYQTAFAICERAGRIAGKGAHIAPIMQEAQKHGIEFKRLALPSEAITTRAISFIWPKGTYYLATRKHAFTLRDGVVLDNGGLREHRNEWLAEVWELVQKPATSIEVKLSRKTQDRFDLSLL